MTKYIKNVFVNGEQKYGVNVEKSAEEMVGFLVHLHYLKQAGEDIMVVARHNENYESTQYIVTRKMKNKTVVHTYDIVEC